MRPSDAREWPPAPGLCPSRMVMDTRGGSSRTRDLVPRALPAPCGWWGRSPACGGLPIWPSSGPRGWRGTTTAPDPTPSSSALPCCSRRRAPVPCTPLIGGPRAAFGGRRSVRAIRPEAAGAPAPRPGERAPRRSTGTPGRGTGDRAAARRCRARRSSGTRRDARRRRRLRGPPARFAGAGGAGGPGAPGPPTPIGVAHARPSPRPPQPARRSARATT